MRGRRRTILLFQPGLDVARQEKALLEYVRERRYVVTSLTGAPSAAVALVRDHLADLVLVCFSSPGTDELADVVRDFGGELEAIRQTRRPGAPTVDQRNARLAQQAAERGATPEMIAAVLGMPVDQVLAALGQTGHDTAERPAPAREIYTMPLERRPTRGAGGDVHPRERRPQPLRPPPSDDYGWRTDSRATSPADLPEPASGTGEALGESARTRPIHRVPRPTGEASEPLAEHPRTRRPRVVRSA